MVNQQAQTPQTQGNRPVGSPINNDTYNLISALHAKLEGLEAYRKYQASGNQHLWQQLSSLDNQAVQLLTQELERMVQSGGLRLGQPGQTGGQTGQRATPTA